LTLDNSVIFQMVWIWLTQVWILGDWGFLKGRGIFRGFGFSSQGSGVF